MMDWAQQVLAEQPRPPYATIERSSRARYRSQRSAGGLAGHVTSQMAAELDLWISHYVGSYRGQAVKMHG
jgi:hypothetical protein